MNSYYYRGAKGTDIGPLEEDELEQLYSAQIVIDSTMIIEVGTDNWERYDTVFTKLDDLQENEGIWTPFVSCPMCFKRFDAVGWEFTDETHTCPHCNAKATAKQFIGSSETTSAQKPAHDLPSIIKQEIASEDELAQPMNDAVEPQKFIVDEVASKKMFTGPSEITTTPHLAKKIFIGPNETTIFGEPITVAAPVTPKQPAPVASPVAYEQPAPVAHEQPASVSSPPISIQSPATQRGLVYAPSPAIESAWMIAKFVYALLILPLLMLLYGSVLSLNRHSYLSSRSVRENDLIIILVVTAIFVAIGFLGERADKRINLKYENGMKKAGWRRLRPVRIAILTTIALGVICALGYSRGQG